jgi:hypothetical protein
MRKLIALVTGALLTLILTVPAMAHPVVPEQSVCVINANAVTGGHTAAGHIDGVAAHVLFVKSPHYCA